MKVKATFAEFSVVLEAADLGRLVEVVTVPVTVACVNEAPVAVPAKRGRKPGVPSAPSLNPDGTPKKRGRPSKAEMEARAAAAAGGGDAAAAGGGDAGGEPKDETPAEPKDEKPEELKDETPAEPAKPAKPAGKGGKGKAAAPADVPAPEAMLKRFTKLVDKDYDVASSILETFGVDRFSSLKAEQHGDFSEALSKAGV